MPRVTRSRGARLRLGHDSRAGAAAGAGVSCNDSPSGHVPLLPAADALALVPMGPIRYLAIEGAVCGARGLQFYLRTRLPATVALSDGPAISQSNAAETTAAFSLSTGRVSKGLAGRPGCQGPLVPKKASGVAGAALF